MRLPSELQPHVCARVAVSQPGSEWLSAAEGLRALALALVFLTHSHGQMQPNAVSTFLVQIGSLGTNIFLVLAGYFAWRSQILKPTSHIEYLRRRAKRLYPLYWRVFYIYLALGLFFPERLNLPAETMDRAWTLLQNVLLLAPLFGNGPLLDVSWTLTILLAFYVVCPWMVRVLNWWTGPVRIPVLSLAVVGMLAQPWVSTRLSLLFAGALIFEAGRTRFKWLLGVGAVLLCCGFLLAGNNAWWFLTAAVLICWFVIELPPDWLSNPWLRWIGRRGFAFYLAHGLPILAFFHFVAPRLTVSQVLACQPLVFAASLGFSALIHAWAEYGNRPSYEARSLAAAASARAYSLRKTFESADHPQPASFR